MTVGRQSSTSAAMCGRCTSRISDCREISYTWQYDLRWAAYSLRESGQMKADNESPQGIWELAEPRR